MATSVVYNPPFARPSNYETCARAIVTTIALAAIIALGAIILRSQITMGLKINQAAIIGLGCALPALFVGAAALIRRILNDPQRGSFWGQSHWLPVRLKFENPEYNDNIGMLDTSTAHTKKCFVYNKKQPFENEMIASLVFLSALPHAALSIVGSAANLFLAPFKAKPLAEIANSLWHIVAAPFYGTALMLGSIYTFVDPTNGLKLSSAIENELNDRVPLHKAFWIVAIGETSPIEAMQRYWNGGGLYIPGCYQPIAEVTLDDEQLITSAVHYGYLGGENKPKHLSIENLNVIPIIRLHLA